MKNTISKMTCLISLSGLLYVGSALASAVPVDTNFKLVKGTITGSGPTDFTVSLFDNSSTFPLTRNADGSYTYSVITNGATATGVRILISGTNLSDGTSAMGGECSVIFQPGQSPLISSAPMSIWGSIKHYPVTCTIDSQDNIVYKVSPPVNP